MHQQKPGKRLSILFALLFLAQFAFSQLPYGILDGRDGDLRCESCETLMNEKPPEVLFGIDIHRNGEVYFSMTNRQWFDKIFSSPTAGITADIVSRNRYGCNVSLPNDNDLLRGHLLRPLYKKDFKHNMKELQNGHVMIKIGKLPIKFLNKELEGNLVILNGAAVCYYTNFVNIDRAVWELLPMGLYTDTLLHRTISGTGNNDLSFTYTKKLQVTVPFQKGMAEYDIKDIKPLYDSLELKDFTIRKIEIRAYSSVEGPAKVNNDLMKRRADAIVTVLQQFQPGMKRISIITAENWLEFYRDIKQVEFASLSNLSKAEVKRKLSDKTIADQIEPVLAGHRKAVITIYLDSKSEAAGVPDDSIISAFNKAITDKDIKKSRIIQTEIVNRIKDSKLPEEYINRLEVPASKEYMSVLNDREIYRYLLQTTSEFEALENFLQIQKLDPSNGHVNYNICALRFFMWQRGDSLDTRLLLQDINALDKQDINAWLVKRMLINYHILKCGDYMDNFDYAAKDQALLFIKNTYPEINLTDEEVFSLAKYFSFYTHSNWAEELVEPRIDKIDVSEDVVFYYVNLGFYHPMEYGSDQFRNAMVNAISLNRERFCEFFMPAEKGGAGMQLLESEELKKMYCENCPRD